MWAAGRLAEEQEGLDGCKKKLGFDFPLKTI